MALPGTPDVARIAIQWTRDGQIEENILYVQDDTGAIFATPELFLDEVHTAVTDNLLPTMFADIVLSGLTFEDVRSVPFGGLSVSITPAEPGALSSTANLPNSVCIAVKKNTGNLGRSGRGRLYWPSLDASVLSDDNTVESAFAGDVVDALGQMQVDIEGSAYPCQVGIVSYYNNGALRSAGLFQQITSWSVADLTVDSQRKRLPGRGR